MVYFFALLAFVAVLLLWRLVVAAWSIFAQLGALVRLGVDVHNVWYRVAGDQDSPEKIAADLAKALKS